MAQFIGEVQGNGQMATRLGGKSSGMRVAAKSFAGGAQVCLTVKDGEEYITIDAVTHGGSIVRHVFEGKLVDFLNNPRRK